MKKYFNPRFVSDLRYCSDFKFSNETIRVGVTHYVIGYFPYEIARVRVGDSYNSTIQFPRIMLHELEGELQRIRCYDNKYVAVISSSYSVNAYYFHDNNVVVGNVPDITGYSSNGLRLVDRYVYLRTVLTEDYRMKPEAVNWDIFALRVGKRGTEISDNTANAITSPFFLKYYGSEAEYHKSKINAR